MDLQTLEKRTGLPSRKLRYIVDHDIVPGLDLHQDVHAQGRPRRFADDMGVAIAAAATLLEIGLSRDAIRFVLRGLARIHWDFDRRKRVIVADLLNKQIPAIIQIGDGTYLRILSGSYDSGWIQPEPLDLCPDDYSPIAFVEFDLGRIRDKVLPS